MTHVPDVGMSMEMCNGNRKAHSCGKQTSMACTPTMLLIDVSKLSSAAGEAPVRNQIDRHETMLGRNDAEVWRAAGQSPCPLPAFLA